MSDRPPDSPAPGRPAARRARLAAGAIVGLGALAATWWLWGRREPPAPGPEPGAAPAPDPRLTFPTPYRNVRPDVHYVGDAACADCHRDQADSFRHHPMGRALAPVAEATPIERYDPAAHNPFTASGLRYAVDRRDGRVVHREWTAGPDGRALAQVEEEVQFAIGSGARTRSYAVNHDGYLFQSPITWFPHSGRWDLSPSYEFRNLHFSRAITPGCLFCHCTQADHVPGTVNRYRPPVFHGFVIGCERCHGPGELHVARWAAGGAAAGPDDTIVNPARLEYSLREAVCQQCHLQGEQRVVGRGRGEFDFRPGLPLYPFLMDYVDRRAGLADTKFVNSVEQMTASRCYRESREPKRLGCTSCHDAHKVPAPDEKAAYFRGRCLQCHTPHSCSLPEPVRREQNKDDSCIACHMPRGASEVVHTAITDHRVPRRPAPAAPADARRPTPGPDDLVPFHRSQLPAGDEEELRNRGLAMLGMLERGPPKEAGRRYAAAAFPLLDRAVERDRQDWPAVEGRAQALWLLGRPEEALAGFEASASARPGSEAALGAAGSVALELDRADAARSFFERAIERNPWQSSYHHGLAVASFRRGEWGRAAGECRQALRLEPTATGTRSLLIQCYLWDGRTDQARAEFDTLRQLTAEGRRPDLARWFEQEQRRAGR
jgi:hypothetical protein